MSSPFDLLIPKVPESRETWFWATVTAVDPLRVTRDGPVSPPEPELPYIPEALVPVSSLSVGQRVRCQLYNRTLFIIGPAHGGNLFRATEILGEHSDLNDYIEPGRYSQRDTADATSGSNYPLPRAGILEVLWAHDNMLWQRYTVYSSYLAVYIRGFYNSWGDWVRTTLDSDAANSEVLLSMKSGFTNRYSASYYKVGGVVHCTGSVSGVGTSWATVATLPPGYRPKAFQYYPSGQQIERSVSVRVQTNGDIEAVADAAAYASLAGIVFIAAT